MLLPSTADQFASNIEFFNTIGTLLSFVGSVAKRQVTMHSGRLWRRRGNPKGGGA